MTSPGDRFFEELERRKKEARMETISLFTQVIRLKGRYKGETITVGFCSPLPMSISVIDRDSERGNTYHNETAKEMRAQFHQLTFHHIRLPDLQMSDTKASGYILALRRATDGGAS